MKELIVLGVNLNSSFNSHLLLLISKFNWTLNDIRTEEISKFLEQHEPDFEFDSRSFIQLF